MVPVTTANHIGQHSGEYLAGSAKPGKSVHFHFKALGTSVFFHLGLKIWDFVLLPN
jgi:hypothetical protein